MEIKDFKNSSGLEFKDISSEEYRIYFFSDHVVKIEKPLLINVNRSSGGHRVWDESEVSHYIPAGWKHLAWKVKKGEDHFTF